MGRAEELLRRIKSGQTAAIEGMIRNQEVEELFLDYKRAATDSQFSKLAESDRKNLAKAISGFGNSEGGLIIWGVDCSPIAGIGDVPSWPPVKVPNAKAFKTLLDNASGGLTLPTHGAVEHIEVSYPASPEGFVVTYVPSAMNIPLQTLFPKDKHEFYIRAGSNFLPTPRGVLSAMFGQSPQADFEIGLQRVIYDTFPASGKTSVRVLFKVMLRNFGRGIANNMFFLTEISHGNGAQVWKPNSTEMMEIWTNLSEKDRSSHTIVLNNQVLPPGSIRNYFNIAIVVDSEQSVDWRISVSCGASNAAGRVREFHIPWNTINEIYRHCFTNYPNELSRADGARFCDGLLDSCLQ